MIISKSSQDSQKCTLLIGDILIDRYLNCNNHYFRLGCVGNVLRILNYLNTPTILCTSFPERGIIDYYISKTTKNLIDYTIFKSSGEFNIVEYTIDNNNKVTQTYDHPVCCENLEDSLMADVISKNSFNKIIISDYGLGTIGPLSIEAISEKTLNPNITVFLDSRISNFDDYAGVSWIFPTEKELVSYLRKKQFFDDFSFYSLLNFMKSNGIFLKKSEDGIVKITRNALKFFPGLNSTLVSDQYGAGDMLIGLFSTIATKEKINDHQIKDALIILEHFLKYPGGNGLIPFEYENEFPNTILRFPTINAPDQLVI